MYFIILLDTYPCKNQRVFFFSFFILLLNYEKIQNRFTGPSPQDLRLLDSLTVQARDLARIDPNKSLALTFEVLEKSQELNYKKGLADSYRLLSIASVQARNFVLTREFIEKAKENKENSQKLTYAPCDFGSPCPWHTDRQKCPQNPSSIHRKCRNEIEKCKDQICGSKVEDYGAGTDFDTFELFQIGHVKSGE